MGKRRHPREVFARRLQSAIAAETAWNILPSKLQELHSMAESAIVAEAAADIQAAFGVRAEDQSRLQRVGTVAVLPITGVIQPTANVITRYFGGTALDQLERDFRLADADTQVKTIVLFVDSPGGSASQNDETSRPIYNARGRKPIITFVRGMCCSAGYYLGSSADRIVASSSSYIGSVGTIYVHSEESKFLEMIGVKATVITHGSKKGHGNPYEKLSPEARATLQKMVDDYGNQFVAAVARNRGVTTAVVDDRYGQGQGFIAAEALSRGMIDRVGSWEELLNELNAGPAPLPQRENKSESANAAGVSAVASSVPPPVKPAGQEVCVDPRIKAMLFARGLIPAVDASDDVCKAALNGYFGALNQSVPAEADATVKALMASNAAPAPQVPPVAQNQPVNPPATPPTQTAPVVPPTSPTQQVTDVAAVERQRVLDLQAAGQKLGIDAEKITTAVNNGTSYEAAVRSWMNNAVETNRPLNSQVRVVQEGSERFAIDASNALALRLGCTLSAQERNEHVNNLSRAPLTYLAAESLKMNGVRFDQHMPPVQLAEMALAQGQHFKQDIGIQAGSPVNRPGDFPNILSGLANKIFDTAIERSEATWDQWCGRFAEDLPDFKPVPIMGQSEANQMDQIPDAAALQEIAIAEELLSMIQCDRYGNAVSFTPVMLANNDMGTFNEKAFNLQDAWEMTINRLCVNLLVGNVVMLDSVALFHATHNNVIAAGGAGPSAAAWEAMNLLYSAQTTIGGTGYIRGSLRIALVAPKWQVAAEQTFMSLASAGETKNPVTDATINTYRAKNIGVVVEPELQRVSSYPWYGLGDKDRHPVVKVGFMLGWGRKGRRETWYDPETKCRKFSVEGRVGAAATHYRNGVYNPGQ